MIDLSKIISNKKKLIEVVALGYNKFCYQILSFKLLVNKILKRFSRFLFMVDYMFFL